ncbi:fibroblast growth factor receptor 2 isoform X2 [Nematostella vectensis]|uniref:fibroblast growth factor receptor 2 isoform X2 n=1 Tax=Nematostella vectensis TaxID=45351 RepID=UPI001390211F|nr:fibroblast growth factor receptor 2 isoform X2 [Nematostella vectensis]
MTALRAWWILGTYLAICAPSVQPGLSQPKFTKAVKSSYQVKLGESARLKCRASGVPPPYSYWLKNGLPVVPSHRIRIVKNRYLKIKSTVLGDAGEYICVFNNTYGEINASIHLDVKATPEEISTSNGHFPPRPTVSSSILRGAGNRSTVISGSPTKNGEPPRFLDWNKMKRAFIAWPASHSMRLRCQATGTPPLRYHWLKDGKEIKGRRLDPYMNTTLWFFRLKDLVPTDTGKYTCIVSNAYGSINHTYTLRVIAKPRSRPILQRNLPRNTSIELGGNATLDCIVVVSGTLPDFRWLKWDKVPSTYPELDLNNGSYTLIDPVYYRTIEAGETYGVQLTVVNVTKKDLGLYTCYVSNHIGKDYVSAFLSEKIIPTTTRPVILVPTKKSKLNVNTSSSEVSPTVAELSSSSFNPSSRVVLAMMGVVLVIAIIGGLAVYYFYRRKLRGHRSKGEKTIELKLPEGLLPETLINEPDTPTSIDAPIRTFPYANSRTRIGSTGSANSSTPLIRYRNGSYRSRFSSGVSSRLDSSSVITEDFYELPIDEDWEIDRSQITIKEQLGEGAFGLVMKAEALGLTDMPYRHTVAVKMLKADATENELADLLSEMDTMKNIGSHKNIINLIGACTQNGPLYVVVEFAPHGNLRQFLRERRPSDYHRSRSDSSTHSQPSLIVRDFISFAFQIARGMEYLSFKKCIHRDLAARNILVGEDYVMKIADFGLARNVRDMDYYRKATDGRLPIKWLAIEALFDRVYTTQSDVWTFGILLWEIFTLGGSPYPGIPVEKLFELLKSGYRMQMPQKCPDKMYDIMLSCWNENPNARPSFTELRAEFDKMLTSMTDKEYLEILAKSVDHVAGEMEAPITDESDTNTDTFTESSC